MSVLNVNKSKPQPKTVDIISYSTELILSFQDFRFVHKDGATMEQAFASGYAMGHANAKPVANITVVERPKPETKETT